MRIAFIGQLGLPPLLYQNRGSAEARVEVLSRKLAELNHSVTLFGTKPYLRGRNYHGVILRRLFSLDPKRPGGWLYLTLSALAVVRTRPDVVHVQGWRAAIVLRIVKFLLPGTTLVLTIDTLPAGWRHRWLELMGRFLVADFSTTTVPTRQLQYRLLTELAIRAQYIPDGYEHMQLAPVPVKHFGLRMDHYVVTVADSPQAVRRVARAFTNVRGSKKLVVLQEAAGSYKRLQRDFPFVSLVGEQYGRARLSLMAGATAVVLADDSADSSTVLRAMDIGRAIVAAPEPLYQETLGVTARFVKMNDAVDLRAALRDVTANAARRQKLGRAAQTRARNHFSWDRVLLDYIAVYAAQARRVVPLDAAQPVSFVKLRQEA